MRARFEVQVQRDGRWVVEETEATEEGAIARANRFLQRGGCSAVRVVRDRLGRDTTVFEKQAGGGGSDSGRATPASPITEAADCAEVDDLTRLEARLTAAKVLRKWFDANHVTPLETLHSYRALARLMDTDAPVYPSAVDRVATIQARRAGVDARERREVLFRLLEEAGRRTRAAEGEKAIRKLGLATFPKLCATAEKVAWIPQDRDVMIRVAVARDLIGQGGWLPKLDALLGAVSAHGAALAADDLAILDGFIADVLASPKAIQDILGDRPNLARALLALIDIMEGKADADGGREVETVTVLRRLMAEGVLTAAWQVLRDRVVSEVQGTNPLSRNAPEEEAAAFQELVDRIVGVRRLGEGADMARALTARCGRRFTEGGVAGQRRAIAAMGQIIGNKASRLRYLLDLLDGELEDACAADVARHVHATVSSLRDVHDLVDRRRAPPEKLSVVGGLQRGLLAAPLPKDVAAPLVDRLDTMAAAYLVRDRVVERLDDPGDSLRVRATRLVRFVSSGILMEGKAMDLARARVVEHLKRPDFVAEFTVDVEDAAGKEAAVRDFWSLLTAAGFKGAA